MHCSAFLSLCSKNECPYTAQKSEESGQYLKKLSNSIDLFLKETLNSAILFSQTRDFADYFENIERFGYGDFLYAHGDYP